MPGGGGTREVQTTQSTAEPWEGQKPYLEMGFGRARDWVLNQPREFFPGSTVVDYSDPTQQAIAALQERGVGTPLTGAATGALGDTLGGDYLMAGNPYMSAMTDRMAADILPRVQAGFGTMGRTGTSPIAQETATRALGDAMAPIYFQNYGDERARMMQAAGMAPTVNQMGLQDITSGLQAGGLMEAKDRERLQEEMNRFYFAQEEPTNRLAQYMGLIGGNYGGQTTQQFAGGRGDPLMYGLGGLGTLAGIAGNVVPLF